MKGDAMELKPIYISRRRMLARGAAVLAGSAVTLGLGPSALAKAAKSAFLYQDRPHDGKRCADCKHFSPNGAAGTCAIVEGTVSADGWCQAFTPKT
jgi:High potential iron-sulfur protein